MFCKKVGNADLAIQFVNDFLTQKKGVTLGQEQVNLIAQTAFVDYKRVLGSEYKSLKIENLDSEHQKQFVAAIERVLVSADSPWKPSFNLQSENQKLFFDLMRGIMPPLSKIFGSWTLLKAVFWKKDLEILAEAKTLLQHVFEDIYHEIDRKIQEDTLTEEEAFHYEVIIGDLLALFPFLRPEEGSELKVPVKVDDQWQLAAFTVNKIELTPKWMGSPYTAYGLSPNKEGISPLLLYKGTTYPTDTGFLLSLLTDINPITSVGSYIFKLGRKKVENWLETEALRSKKKTVVYGKSLGGAQSWRTGINFPEYISKVMAYGAPGFSKFTLKKLDANSTKLPEINFFSQANDIVPFCDEIADHKNVHYYKVISSHNSKGVAAHAHIYSTHESSTILKETNIKLDQPWTRFAITLAHGIVSLIAFPILGTIYFVYNTINQTYKFVAKQLIALSNTRIKSIQTCSKKSLFLD